VSGSWTNLNYPFREFLFILETRDEIDHPRVVPEPAERMVVGIDGAFIKAGHTGAGQRHQFEILTGRVEASQRGGEAFAVVRDLDPYAKRRVHPFSGAAVEDKTRI
jgi:hypothetical protein